jgi:hypothetical protein
MTVRCVAGAGADAAAPAGRAAPTVGPVVLPALIPAGAEGEPAAAVPMAPDLPPPPPPALFPFIQNAALQLERTPCRLRLCSPLYLCHCARVWCRAGGESLVVPRPARFGTWCRARLALHFTHACLLAFARLENGSLLLGEQWYQCPAVCCPTAPVASSYLVNVFAVQCV